MLFLRPFFPSLAAIFVGVGVLAVVRAETPAALAVALPERSLPGLEALLRQGLDAGPTILIRRWEAERSQANARAARAPMLPYASASVSGGQILEQRESDGVPVPDRNVVAALYNVGVSQPIFHWGALSKGYQAAKLYQAISARNVEETRRLLAVDLRRRYFDLVIATGALELVRSSIADLEREKEFAQKQVAAGFASSLDSGAVEAKLLVARMEIQRLTNDRDLLARNLARSIGVTVDKLPVPPKEIPATAAIDEAVKALTGDASGVVSARQQNAEDLVRIEQLNYEVAKKRLLPKLGLSLSANQDNRNADNDAFGTKQLITSYQAFATVNWTIFDGFGAQAAQRAALVQKRAYEADRDLLARAESDERRTDVAKLQYAWRQLQEAEKGLSVARASVAISEKDRAAGWVPASTVDEARRLGDVALQAANISRAEFYTALATYFSNRGLDPALQLSAR